VLRRLCFAAVAMLLLVFCVGQASAMNVVDLYDLDMNMITGQGYGTGGPPSQEYFVYEDYNEQYLVPYPSHDGMGIVNEDGMFFDKIMTIDRQLDHGVFDVHFYVTNTTDYLWSDYHFEFWDDMFTMPIDIGPAIVGISNGYNTATGWYEPFANESYSGMGAEFWAPARFTPDIGDPYLVYPGGMPPEMSNWLHLYLNVDMLPQQFGIRQVATTIPEPSTLLLVALGLVGLIGWKRR
jgi:hypothetical protein